MKNRWIVVLREKKIASIINNKWFLDFFKKMRQQGGKKRINAK